MADSAGEHGNVVRIGRVTTNQAYMDLVSELTERNELGDEFARKVIGAMALLISGWRYGDPEPEDYTEPTPPDDGELGDILLQGRAA